MPSLPSTLANETGIAPSDLYQITGPLLISCFLGLILYGILCDQVYIYYVSFPNDHLATKTVVYVLWLAETVQTVSNIIDTFDTFCYNFGNLVGLDDVHLTWFTISILSGFVGCIAQSFYAWRMYKFSEKVQWLSITLSVLAFAQFAAAICCGLQVRKYDRYSDLQKSSRVKVAGVIWLSGAALCDAAIASCMTYLLSRAHTGLKSTQALLSRLIRLTIETGATTAALALVDIALFLAYPNNCHTVPAKCLIKMYSNVVLAVCNSRMTGRIRGGREATLAFHSFESFDMSIGGLNTEFQDTETNANTDSSLPPECSQRGESPETR